MIRKAHSMVYPLYSHIICTIPCSQMGEGWTIEEVCAKQEHFWQRFRRRLQALNLYSTLETFVLHVASHLSCMDCYIIGTHECKKEMKNIHRSNTCKYFAFRVHVLCFFVPLYVTTKKYKHGYMALNLPRHWQENVRDECGVGISFVSKQECLACITQ